MTVAVGTQHETAVTLWFRKRGWPYARRRTRAGAKDEGDIALGDGIPVTIEAKTYKVKTSDPISLGAWMKELDVEIVHSDSEFGFIVAKRRGTTDVGQYFAITSVSMIADLMERAGYRPEHKVRRISRS